MKLLLSIKQLIVALILFLVIDALYLGAVSGEWNKLLLRVQRAPLTLKVLPAIGVYVLIFCSWYYFVYSSYLKHNSVNLATKSAFILGFTTYGIYGLTNMAIINQWRMKHVIMDTLWGSILYTAVTYLALKYT